MTVTSGEDDYAKRIARKLKENQIRIELDLRNEKIGYKIREAEMEKVPYSIIIGKKEVEKNNISLRQRGKGDLGGQDLDKFIHAITQEINQKQKD